MKKNAWCIAFIFLLIIQSITAIYFCSLKKGFHEDEYYSYYSTCYTNGLSVPDGDWLEHDDYYNEFIVLDDQGFQYNLVKTVQSWDVHPPVYYWTLHTICSLFQGQFSKWFGLSINLVCFIIEMILLMHIVLKLTKHNYGLAFIICSFYGFSPAIMSITLFIRMYALLTVWVYLCVLLHLNAIEYHAANNGKLSLIKSLIPIAIVTYLGFLTHYYYFIFIFFIGLGFSIYLLIKDRKLSNCVKYVITIGCSLILCVLTYPSCIRQMFGGYRGAGAVSSFIEISNTFTRLKYFVDITNEYVFGNTLFVFFIILFLLVILALIKKVRFIPSAQYSVLLFALLGYFIAVSKTALTNSDDAIRYESPIYGLIIALMAITIYTLSAKCQLFQNNSINIIIYSIALITCIGISIYGLFKGNVRFLYNEDIPKIAFSKEQAQNNTPVIYLYNSGDEYSIWDCSNELFSYSEIYFASQNSNALINDSKISQSNCLIVYVGIGENEQSQLERVLNSNNNISSCELKFNEKYCNVYYLY